MRSNFEKHLKFFVWRTYTSNEWIFYESACGRGIHTIFEIQNIRLYKLEFQLKIIELERSSV